MDFFRIAEYEGTSIFNEKSSEWSTVELYLLLKEVVIPIKVVNDCAERSLVLVTNCHIDSIGIDFLLIKQILRVQNVFAKFS